MARIVLENVTKVYEPGVTALLGRQRAGHERGLGQQARVLDRMGLVTSP